MIQKIGRPRLAALGVAMIAFAVLNALVPAPASAAPPPNPTVPDSGARPPVAAAGAAGANNIPGAPASLSPGAQQQQTEMFAVQALAEQLKQLDEQVTRAQADVQSRQSEQEAADSRLTEVQSRAEQAAAEAYKASKALGPFGEYAHDLHKLSRVTPALGAQAGGDGHARELARAEAAARTAADAFRTARDAASGLITRRNATRTQYDQRAAALAALAVDPRREAELEAYENALGANYNLGAGPNGWAPNPLVAKVLEFATAQRGKPYVFGAEGPSFYDCSGLVWAAYRQVGKFLPRIANEQYRATTKINVTDLLPGDLVFFGPPGPWMGIHHVGIYIGDKKMIQAPATGQVVKVSSVWWTRFYGATRVLPAVKVTDPGPLDPGGSDPMPSNPPPSSEPPSSPPPSSEPPSSPPPSDAKEPSESPDPSGSSGSGAGRPRPGDGDGKGGGAGGSSSSSGSGSGRPSGSGSSGP